MPLPPDLRWLDPLLDVLVDEFFERRFAQQVQAPPAAVLDPALEERSQCHA